MGLDASAIALIGIRMHPSVMPKGVEHMAKLKPLGLWNGAEFGLWSILSMSC